MPEMETMLGLGDDIVWRPRSGVLSLISEGRVVLLGPESSQPSVLEGAAAAVWHALKDENSLRGVVSSVTDAFDVSEDVARTDVCAFIEGLHRRGLVEKVGSRG